tara:strand:+ start:20478 stop:20963 length:486 start_codon:yes stop_codon:yes gene_type:complete
MSRKIKFWTLPFLFLIYSCSQDPSEIITDDAGSAIVNEASITQEILKLVNSHRKSVGKSSLARNDFADQLATDHTNYMISKNQISHDNFNQRFQELQQNVNAKSAGENVASGYPTAESVMDGWINSSGHKANIEGDFTHIGITAIKNSQGSYYYTQLFFRK